MRFAIIGAAAYIAPRHMQAITDTGNDLIAAMDLNDNVGILDQHNLDCAFFTSFERFDRHLSKLARRGNGIDWLSVCTPNWLHDSHCMSGMRWGANVICEKPLVLTPQNLAELTQAEEETGKRVRCVMQLRHHAAIQKLEESLDSSKIYDVCLTYITGRGSWFYRSWKGDETRSGGLIFNIGIHFLDLLGSLFGEIQAVEVRWKTLRRITGWFEFERARVKWYLSTACEDVPHDTLGRTYRSLTIDSREIEFSNGFDRLHTRTYEEALAGRGITIADVRPSIELAYKVQHQHPSWKVDPLHYHPLSCQVIV